MVAFPELTAALLTTSVVVSTAELDESTARLLVSAAELMLSLLEIGNEVGNEVGLALLPGVRDWPNVDVSIGDGKATDEAASVGATEVSVASTVKGSPQELVCAEAMPRRVMRMAFWSSDCFILVSEVVLLMMRYSS